ncbi:hypothetical protein [Burkholderia gladioli]|uniref:hypothetical protein n=1 Tax=Burkholderia gladioli TaxID=28095 RepID=UPI0016418013|nr:hypothetical protein [Burkholderia gladioli]
MSESKQRGDAVAVVGTTYQLLWIGSGPIAPIIEQHGIKVGDRLYHGPAAEAAPELVEALQSIAQYGSDTLSGRTDGPDDREWQREAVLEMTRRARAALAKAGA